MLGKRPTPEPSKEEKSDHNSNPKQILNLRIKRLKENLNNSRFRRKTLIKKPKKKLEPSHDPQLPLEPISRGNSIYPTDSNSSSQNSNGLFPISNKKKKISKSGLNKKKKRNMIINSEKRSKITFLYRQFRDSTPLFARPRKVRDKNMKRPGDEGYDPCTIHIPDHELNHLTKEMFEYWQVKKYHNEKVILVKKGTFYNIYYEDSKIANKVLDLEFMNDRMAAGFPEGSLNKNTLKLIEGGYTVGIMDVVERGKTDQGKTLIGEELEEYKEICKSQKKELKNLVIDRKRELVKVLTRGTFFSEEVLGYQNQYLWTVYSFGDKSNLQGEKALGFCILEVSIGTFLCGILEENVSINLMSLLHKYPPVEVVFDNRNLESEILKYLESSVWKPNMTSMNHAKKWEEKNIFSDVMRVLVKFEVGHEKISMMKKIIKGKEINNSIIGAFNYLKQLYILDEFICNVNFEIFDPRNTTADYMLISPSTLETLEILDNKNSPVSLYQSLNHCVSPPGKRELRNWIISPLLNHTKIEQRLDAVEELIQKKRFKRKFRNNLKKLADFERKLIRVYKYSLKRKKFKSYKKISRDRIKDIKLICEKFRKIQFQLIELKNSENFESFRLKQLLSPEGSIEKGLIPDISSIVDRIQKDFIWKKVYSGKSESREYFEIDIVNGCNQEYDSLKQKKRIQEMKLEKVLKKIKKRLKCNQIKYVSIKKKSYQIEIPNENRIKIPKDFTYSSKKMGYTRYSCEEVEKLVKDLEEIQQEMDTLLGKFTFEVFSKFVQEKTAWKKFCCVLKELDCLTCFSEVIKDSKSPMVRPIIFKRQAQESAKITLKQNYHFPLEKIKPGLVFNDINLGNKNSPMVSLLTGSNMSGKSTLMKQLCLTVIMGQIGCFVPAKYAKFSIVDKIFTRIGASDRLCLGKSTFLIELEDMKEMINFGTKDSLCVVDELGRGTNFREGVSIAAGFLKELSLKKCRTIFSTHLHFLMKYARFDSNVKYEKMKIQICENGGLNFLFKLESGVARGSFGLEVARIANLNEELLEIALEKSVEHSRMFLESVKETDQKFNDVMQDLGMDLELE